MSTTYAIVDIETTGTSAENGKITEIAVIRFDGEKIVDSFQTLINPERNIPFEITRITGITNEMVRDAPKFYEVAKDIVEVTEDAVFVAHNVGFDYGFLRKEFGRLGFTFSRKQLCTVRLTRKVFPGFPSYSLGNLIQRFNISVENRHRAYDDALATVELLKLALAENETQDEIDQLINHGLKTSKLPKAISIDFLHSISEETGVYYMHDMEGDVIYVGKAINIRKRIMQHFANDKTKGQLIHQYVADITYTITGSELVALLLESSEIKRLQPKLNRALRRRLLPFVIWSYYDDNGYLRFDSGKMTKTEAKKKKLQVLGDFPKKMSARNRIKTVVADYELCNHLSGIERVQRPCFDFHLKRCHGACIGHEAPDDYNARALEAMTVLSRVSTDTFAILDTGRDQTEKAIIYVEDGQYRGYGYIDGSESFSCLEDVVSHISPARHHQDSILIIRRWLKPGNRQVLIK